MKIKLPSAEPQERPETNTSISTIYMTLAANKALCIALEEKLQDSHEGVVFLGGWITGCKTIITTILHPDAKTTTGSYVVSSRAMARIIDRACSIGLEVVGQLHTHPMAAYHSDGDVTGATLVRAGFVSIVVPNYGSELPDLTESCAYVWDSKVGFEEYSISSIRLIPNYADCRTQI